MSSVTDQPLVSVVMPAYNAERYLGASITGVLAQTYPNVELIVVDDGSTDRTAQVAGAYTDCLRYVRQENAGSSAARNHGLSVARGEFVALCDSDDVFAPAYIETMLETYRSAGGGRRFVTTDAVIYTDTGVSHGRRLVGGRRHPQGAAQRLAILQQNFVPYFTLTPIEMFRELDGFACEVRYNEDWDFYLRAILAGWEAVQQLVPLMEYRWVEGSKSTETGKTDEAQRQILRRALDQGGLEKAERDYVTMALERGFPRSFEAEAGAALRAGDPAGARQIYRELTSFDLVDKRLATKARVMATVPGAARLWSARLRRIDAAMGRHAGDNR